MRTRSINPFRNVTGIEIGVVNDRHDVLLSVIGNMLKVAVALTQVEADRRTSESGQRSMSIALSASTQAVNALFAVAAVQCHLAHPPQDIEMKLNAAGNLIYRCYHTPPHEWDLSSGKRLP